MTNLIDFDRSLADFLADGPNTAPEAPVIAALAHARTTPRRPDLLGRLRSDVMAPPRTFGLIRRPAMLFALLALIVAGIGVAVIGSQPKEPSVVVPGPSPSPVEASPSTAPSTPFSGQVQVILAGGQPLVVTVTDTTGALVAAGSATPGDGGSIPDGNVAITADPTDPNVLVATWTGGPCETRAAMQVDEVSSTISIIHETCTGDAIGFDRIIRLTFRAPVDAALWHGTVVGEPQEGSPTPSALADTTHLELASTPDSPVSIDIVDQSGHLKGAVSGPAPAGSSVEFITASNVDGQTVRLVWPGSICDTVHRLTIAADHGLTVDRPNCQVGADVRERSVLLTFDRAVDANALDTALFSGRPGLGMPTWAVTGRDSAGGRYVLAIDDASASVINVAGLDSTGVARPDDQVRLDQAGQAVVELVWAGQACETTPSLAMDAAGTTWQLTPNVCDQAPPAVVRRISLKLAEPRSIDTIAVQLLLTGP